MAKGAAVAALPTWFVNQSFAMENDLAPQRKKFGPNDTINIGVIGTGGPRGGYRQGFSDANSMRGKPGVKLIAVCDVDSVHRDWAANEYGGNPTKYHDYRDLLANKSIDAVVIGTPDHWHSTIAIDAMHAGKDVYCEKPLTLTIGQGREICDAQADTKAVFQTGSQQRSDDRFRLACELVRNGRIGKVHTITTHLPTGPTGGPFESEAVPEGFDWNMWMGPTMVTDYIKQRTHGDFRWWLDYSGGMLTDWGAHHNDIAQWAMDMDHSGPLTVEGTAKNPPMTGTHYYNTFPEFDLDFLYANGVKLHCTNQGENGVMFEGDGGWIFVSRERIGASEPKLLQEPLGSNAVKLYVSTDHTKNFIDCMRTRQLPICNAEVGHRSATVCHLANICLQLKGRKLSWDAKKERFINDPVADSMLSRPKRKWD